MLVYAIAVFVTKLTSSTIEYLCAVLCIRTLTHILLETLLNPIGDPVSCVLK